MAGEVNPMPTQRWTWLFITVSNQEPHLPQEPLQTQTLGSSRKHWILGVVITAILPFLSHKWGPLFKLTKEVENAVETADDVTEAMENIAEQVEKVADEIGDELPEGGRLQKAFAYVENKAKKAARDAHSVEQFIDKVEALEEEVDSFIDEANEITKEAKDKKPST
ncbi:uncharacterized protein LOC132279250 isoform X3 [Cornus florida]|uniref:uncharacterized protein LOC132279250 isoform X3 n=1 Tax=Cornus florida TaxID=4283 RepID=UPI0028975FAE|nr:uncharacterized protein LOC132279250 isoform X3 [Cornus florida]